MQNSELPRQYKIVINDEFYDMLDEVVSFYDGVWAESSVQNFKFEVWQKIQNLSIFPNGYRKWRDVNYRYCLVWDYFIFFRVNEKNGEVRVYWIFHSARDLKSLLNEKEEK